MAITQGVIDAIAERLPGARVLAVHLEIGKLSGVLPDAVRFCFGIAGEGTAVDGARLDITEPEGRARCRSCGSAFATDDLLTMCRCGSVDVEVTGGQDMRITAVEVGEHV